jgi:OOP family OmpA-OmpF porin
MRKALGAGVFIAGVAGLGVWGAHHQAETMEDEITTAATGVADDAIHRVETGVAGRDITVRGIADSEAERDALIAALDAVEGRRVVRDEIEVLETVSPYTLSAQREDGVKKLAGHIPHERLRSRFSALEADGVGDLTLASGAPENWATAAEGAITALAPLDRGQMALQDSTVKLTGLARGPQEREAALASLAGLPDGYDTEASIEMRDDGSPPSFEISWDAGQGASVVGKLPKGMTARDVTAMLGLDEIWGEPETALFDHGQRHMILPTISGMGDWLAQSELATLTVENGASYLMVMPTPGADLDLISRSLGEAIPKTDITVIEAEDLPEDGAMRLNAATGQSEQFTGGYWLPVLDFAPDASTCASQSEAALQAAKINFVTGSARLGPRALGPINRVAAVMRRCVNDAGLTAELGGHTDNTGNAEANHALSLSRAQAVKAALQARGVPGDALATVGYGQSEPIADNSTDEGRAANRRTTIQWFAGE